MFSNKIAYQSILITHPSRNDEEKKRLLDATSVFDKVIFIRRPASDEIIDVKLAKELAELINTLNTHIYFPNYRDYPFIALHWINRETANIALCHNNHSSYYDVLKRYITILDGIICPNSEASYFLNRELNSFNVPIKYIPHYVEQLCVRDKNESLSKVINLIYFGRIEREQKEVFEIIKLALALKSKGQLFSMEVIGEGSEKDNFIQNIIDNKLDNEIKILDVMRQDKLFSHLIKAHFSLLFSRYEGFCYSAAESMLAGVPVACYKNNAMIDYVSSGKNGLEVDWGNAQLLAQNMIEIFKNEDIYKQMSQEAIDTINNKFCADKICNEYELFFESAYTHRRDKYWPLIRSRIEPRGLRIFERIIEYAGKKMGVWF